MKVVVAGVGAFGQKHLDGLRKIDGVEVVAIVGRQSAPTQEVAKKYAYRVDRMRIPCVSAWTKEIAKIVERDPEHRELKTA